MGYRHEIPGGAAWSATVRAGRRVEFTAGGAGANLALLIIGADRLDRLNVPDTLKAQMSACIRPPMVLMSDRGLALASVVGSTLDWHDALTGFGHDTHLERFGPSSYALDRNGWRRSARTGLVSELTKHGLSESDLHGCVNVFSKVAVTGDSRLSHVAGHCRDGDTLTLRAEQDLLLVAATAPHPMDPGPWSPPSVHVTVTAGAEPVAGDLVPDDPSYLFRDESARALTATREAFL
jgi:uncharacterized protein YcgI (DUF1989 family)